MAIEIQAPKPLPNSTLRLRLFLAGSIEMGTAERWQDRIKSILADRPIILLNPRRDDWDNSWVQRKDNPQFREQVEWELRALELSDKILLYFDPVTRSPISLLELGLYARSGRLIVCCPDGFWRKGNVDIVCERYGVPMIDRLDDILELI